jgi:hypothetical protein
MMNLYELSNVVRRERPREWSDDVRDMDAVYSYFEALALPTLASSRIGEYRRVFRALLAWSAGGEKLTPAKAEIFFHAKVEFAQLRRIIAAARSSSNQASWNRQLRTLAKDLAVPVRNAKHSSARDFQWEAYLAAVFELSGCVVCFQEPPDLIVSTDSFRLGCAAKRPRSVRNIEATCRDAVDQIGRSGLPGIVALDLSFALGVEGCINTDQIEGAATYLEAATIQFLAQYGSVLARVCEKENVVGIFTYVHMPVLVIPTLEVTSAYRWTIIPLLKPTDSRFAWIWELERRIDIGVFNFLAAR